MKTINAVREKRPSPRRALCSTITGSVAALGVLLLIGVLVGCKSKVPHPPPSPSPKAYQVHKMKVESQKRVTENKYVLIDGDDLQLPLSGGALKPPERRTYSFYVWAYHPEFSQTMSLQQMREQGVLNVEVIGVKAAILTPDYRLLRPKPSDLAFDVLPPLSPGDARSRNVLEIRVESEDLVNGTKPFTIVAWFPDEYMSYELKDTVGDTTDTNPSHNPWGERREVKVYSGDLRTRIDIVDQNEVAASFGKRFSEHFYVGRVFLRNRHPDKRLMVYTTSMRASILLYRPPIPPEKAQEDLTAHQKLELQKQGERVDQQFARHLRPEELNQIFTLSHKSYSSNRLLNTPRRQTNAKTIADNQLGSSVTNALKLNDGQRIVMLTWNELDRIVKGLTNQATNASLAIDFSVRKSIAYLNSAPGLKVGKRVILDFASISEASAVEREAQRILDLVNTSSIPKSQKDELAQFIDDIAENRRRLLRSELLAKAYIDGSVASIKVTPGEAFAQGIIREYRDTLNTLRRSLISAYSDTTPFAIEVPFEVNPHARALAFSRDAELQTNLNHVGFMWKETYRPMTFHAVLNSLMQNHEDHWGTKASKVLQSMARLAGGMVGLGVVADEFTSRGYLEGVTIFSTIFVPEVQRHILQDLNKQIRNLGEMGMDSVIVIPPNDVVDRYVFFPKGPIYNHVDEFTVSEPAYIIRIDNDDVSVEGMLVEKDSLVRGGELSGGGLVQRALNEGQADARVNLERELELKEALKRYALFNMIARIETLLAGTTPAGTNGVKDAARVQAEIAVRLEVANFELAHGKDSSGILISVLRQHQVDFADTVPKFFTNAMPSIRLLAGTVSRPIILPVQDDQTPAARLIISVVSTNDSLIPGAKVRIKRPESDTNGPVAVTIGAGAIDDLPMSTFIRFEAKDEFGGVGFAPVKVTVEKPVTKLTIDKQTISEAPSSEVTIGTNEVVRVDVRLPIFDSASEGWKWEAMTTKTNVSVTVSPARIEVTESERFVLGSLTIDASLHPEKTVPLTLTAFQDDQTVATRQFTLRIQP